jgi:hypothetical protein
VRTVRPARPESLTAEQKPRTVPGRGGLRWKWRLFHWPWPGRKSFEGDIAIKALRERLLIDRDVPASPPVLARKMLPAPVSRGGSFAALAAALGCGTALITVPESEPGLLSPKAGAVAPVQFDAVTGTVTPSAHLVIKRRQAFANEPLPLGLSLRGGTGGEVALLSGLLTGTRLSAGSALGVAGWRVAARDLATAMAYAPPDFIGVMDAAIDVRTPSDTLVDRSVMRLEWIGKKLDRRREHAPLESNNQTGSFPAPPKKAITQPIGGVEIAVLLKRGNDYLHAGDLAAARTVLRRAVDAGSAEAALALGSTFDPFVFKQLGVVGFAPDAAQARVWYECAGQLGSAQGARRIDRLSSAAQ